MLIITSLFFLFSSSVIYSKYNSLKSSNSEEKNKWFPGIHGLYSNEYKCISLNIDDLQNDYYSFDISCLDGSIFYYISKFGISPSEEEGDNIAGCFSKSFKNIINIDEDCDLSSYLDEQLNQNRYKEGKISINVKDKNLPNIISTHCINKNQRKKFFLSYSCYNPHIVKNKDKIKRKNFVLSLIRWDTIILFIAYLYLYIDKFIFFKSLKQTNVNIKSNTLMINTLNINREKIPIILNEILRQMKNILKENKEEFEINNINKIIREINYSIIDDDEKELYENFNNLLKEKAYLQTKIGKNEIMPRSLLVNLLSKICKCFKKTYEDQLKKVEKELKEEYLKIIKLKENEEKIKKIYFFF